MEEERSYREQRPLAEIIPPDRRRLRAIALVAGGMIAGAVLLATVQYVRTGEPRPIASAAAPGKISGFRIGSSGEDRASLHPGPVSPDGEPDQEFTVEVEGPINGIALLTTTSTGLPDGAHRWSALGNERPPSSWQLAVLEGERLLNTGDGTAIDPLAAGRHRLRIFASDSGAFQPGSYFQVLVTDPNGAVTSSRPLAFTGHGPVRPVPPAPSPTFDRGAAAAALGRVDLHTCEALSGVDGTGHIVVTFEGDGSVSEAEIDTGGNEHTPRGACIRFAFKAVRVAPFKGGAVRVGKSFTTGRAAR